MHILIFIVSLKCYWVIVLRNYLQTNRVIHSLTCYRHLWVNKTCINTGRDKPSSVYLCFLFLSIFGQVLRIRIGPTDFYESDRTSGVQSDSVGRPMESAGRPIRSSDLFWRFSDSKLLSEVRVGLERVRFESDRVRPDFAETWICRFNNWKSPTGLDRTRQKLKISSK